MAVGTYAEVDEVKKRLAKSDAYSADDNAVLAKLCSAINGWIELKTQRVLSPVDGVTYVFDADAWTDDGRRLRLPMGIRNITTLKLARGTGETLELIPASEYLLLPRVQSRQAGYPATELLLHNAGGTSPIARVSSGYAIAELVGDVGFEDTPAEIVDIAETAVVRAWHGRQAGQTDIIGSDENGEPIVSRYVSAKDRDTLRAYHPYGGVMIG